MSAARLTADSKAAGRAWRQPPPTPSNPGVHRKDLPAPGAGL